MADTISIPRIELETLQERARKLALEKSYLQLVNHLMNSLSTVPGLENTVEAMVRLILDNIGGSNVSIYYMIDSKIHYADVYGEKRILETVADDMVQRAFEGREFVEEVREFEDTKMMTPEFTKASYWALPLMVGERMIGVLKMEGMLMAAAEVRTQLRPFFNYAALVLKNEIESYSILIDANNELARANEELRKSEDALRRAKEELDARVAERTAELRETNDQLQLELAERRRVEDALEKSSREIYDLYNRAPCGYHTLDSDGVFVQMNDTELQWLGYTRDEIISRRKFSDLITDRSLKTFQDNFPRFVVQGQIRDLEFEMVRKDGTIFPVLLSASAVTDSHGNYVMSRSTVYDLTERKRAEQKTRELGAIVQSSDDAIIGKTLDGIITSWNRGAERIYGYTETEVVGKSIAILVPPGREDDLQQILRRIKSGEHIKHYETVRRTKDGRDILMSLTVSRTLDSEGGIVAASTIARDFTESKRAEEALRESEKRYKQLLESVTDYICTVQVKDSRPVATVHGPGCAAVTGYTPEGYKADPHLWYRMVYEQDRDAVTEHAARVLSGEGASPLEHRIIHRDGSIRWVRNTPVPHYDERRQLIGYDGLIADITERKRAEEALRESEEKYRTLFEESFDGLFITSPSGKILDINKKGVMMFGYETKEEMLSLDLETDAYAYSPDRKRILTTVNAQGSAEYEVVVKKKSGEKMVTYCSLSAVKDKRGVVTSYRGIIRDITERKRAENIMQARLRLLEFANSHSMDELLTATLDEIEALTGSTIGFYHFLESDQRTLSLRNWSTNTLRTMCTAVGKGSHYDIAQAGVWADCVYERHPVIHNDYASLPHRKGMPEGHAPVVREVVVPIFRGNHIRAIIGVGNKSTDYGESDMEIVSQLGDLSWDIVERREAEEALRESQQMLHSVLDTIPVRVFWKDLDSNYLGCNRPFALDAGLQSPEEIVGRNDFEVGWGEGAQLYRSDDRLVIETGTPKLGYEEPQTTPCGDRIWLRTSKVPLFDVKGEIKGMLGTYEDITVHKRAEEELRKAHRELERRVEERTAELEKANKELRQIPSKLIAVQEEERKRLASELHDSIGQTLAAVKFWVEMLLKLGDEGDGSAVLNHAEQFIPILQRSIEETRSIYMGLRPSVLDSMGLLATLEWLRRECMKLYPDRHIELETGVAEEEIPETLKVNIFRIVQEALNNVAKHSKAEWVDISLSENRGGIELVVSDDGVGMGLDIIMQTSTATSLGLTSMRERAELTGGSFSIESAPGEGTTIRAFWPIEAEDQPRKGSIT